MFWGMVPYEAPLPCWCSSLSELRLGPASWQVLFTSFLNVLCYGCSGRRSHHETSLIVCVGFAHKHTTDGSGIGMLKSNRLERKGASDWSTLVGGREQDVPYFGLVIAFGLRNCKEFRGLIW